MSAVGEVMIRSWGRVLTKGKGEVAWVKMLRFNAFSKNVNIIAGILEFKP